jgi:hypothetical protein
MLMSSKGFTTRAAVPHNENLAWPSRSPLKHPLKSAGGLGLLDSASCCSGIHLGARGARKVEIVNIGLEPWEAVEMGLFV